MFHKDTFYGRKLFLIFGDLVLFFVALYLALLIRRLGNINLPLYQEHAVVFAPTFMLWIMVYFLFDLYEIRVLKSIYRSLYLLILANITATVLSAVIFYIVLLKVNLSPKTLLVLFSTIELILMIIWRAALYYLFSAVRFYRRVLILGETELKEEIAEKISTVEGVNYKISGFVSATSSRRSSPISNISYLGDYRDLKKIISRHKIADVVIAFDCKAHPHALKTLSDSLSTGIRVLEWPNFYEEVYQKIPTNDIDHFWFIYNIDESQKKLYEQVKRIFDVIMAAFGLTLTLILSPLIALGIKLTSKGPILYLQKRVGQNEKIFSVIKFRTMTANAEKEGAVWAKNHDSRITAFGKFLRRSRLDELPQFINILRGHMSLVGPRPERPEFLPILRQKIPFYYKRNIVRPGVTGFAQIMYPYAASIEDSLEKVGYDLYYIKNRSLFLYFKIILRTIRVILSFSGR